MKIQAYIYGAAFLIGVTLVYFAIKEYRLFKKIVSEGVMTYTEVIDFEKYAGGEGVMYTPVFRYLDSSGATNQFNSDVSYSKPFY